MKLIDRIIMSLFMALYLICVAIAGISIIVIGANAIALLRKVGEWVSHL